jgi:hypothetical protein
MLLGREVRLLLKLIKSSASAMAARKIDAECNGSYGKNHTLSGAK